MRTPHRWILWLVIPSLLLLPGCRQRGEGGPAVDAEEHEHEQEAGPASSVTLTAEAMAAAHITTVQAVRRVIARRLTAPGELEFNARRLAHLTARTAGRIERVLAVEGDRVREGQVLAEIYSPDHMAIQAEFLQASARAKRLAGGPGEAGTARAVLESARERLLLVGASPADVDALAASPAPRPFLPIRAAISGTVLGSGVLPGDHVDLGASLFRLADLTTLWACLHIQEKDLATVRAGVEAVLRTQAYPGEEFRGRLVLIGDVVDPGTRTVEGRVEVPNPAGKLKSGMYVEASFAASGEGEALAVPEASVQDDGGHPVVFVKTGDRTFVRREVVTGERAAGAVEIVGGLAEGETVVVSGSFLLASELRKGSMKDEHGHR